MKPVQLASQEGPIKNNRYKLTIYLLVGGHDEDTRMISAFSVCTSKFSAFVSEISFSKGFTRGLAPRSRFQAIPLDLTPGNTFSTFIFFLTETYFFIRTLRLRLTKI